ncbi:PAS domain S-box protein [Azoarcus sp. KH32C]|uniref:PAS domain-containing hybrid sensor histidine kinase/response regulator n=1 Tax=Azoarcus sp. KH32C TaxID=748247 RepID=UPI00023862F5|nr:PAS domain S-box protein [Azoarcus sp. KH32C]BAL26244.1 putative hybrid sensor and regulator protein [Azoarcus sp. KH32C]
MDGPGGTSAGWRAREERGLFARMWRGIARFITHGMWPRSQALRESEQKLKGLFELSSLGIALTDMQGRFVEFNEAYRSICGCSAAELHDPESRVPRPGRLSEADVRKVLRVGRYGPHEREYLRRNGSLVPVRVSGIVIVGRDGRNYIWSTVEDISARRQVDGARSVSEQRFRDFSLSSADWFWELDANLRLCYLSENFERACGRSAASMLGRTRAEVFAEDDLNAPEMSRAHMALLRRHEPFRNFQYAMRDATGATVWVSVSGLPIFDAQRRFTGYRGVGQNVTAQKAAAEAAERANQLLREAVEQVASGFTIFDEQDRLVICNSAYRDKYALSRDLIVPGATFEEIVRKGAERGQYKDAMGDIDAWVRRRVQEHQNPTGRPIEQELGDGRWILIVENRTPSGYIVGNRIDITERKRTEDQLRKLSRAVEQSAESILITDVEANIEYVNEAFVRTTGYSREETIGRNARFLKSGLTPPSTYASFWGTLRRGEHWQGEMINKRKNGETYPEYVIATPIRDPAGAITHFVAVREDITEKRRNADELTRHRKHLEELVAQRTTELVSARDAAQAAAQAKSEFLANMSHEIRTPMNAILGLTNLALYTELSPKQDDYLRKIKGAANSLLGIINDILDVSKIEAGKVDLESCEFALDEVLGDMVDIIGPRAEEKGLHIRLDVAADVPPVLVGDPLRLRQVLINLGGNAVKFAEHGEVVVVVAPQAMVDGDVMLRFSVRDQGIGMRAAQVAQLFQPFTQADASVTRKHGGTGLGLAISKRLVELMGGEIGVASEPGQGSDFHFTARFGVGHAEALPAAPPAPAEPAPRIQPKLAGLRVLLVEDNEVNQQLARDLLTEVAGGHIVTAGNGEEALERVRREAFDVVLMDIQMPGMSGYDATRLIRRDRPDGELPIIAMTAHALASDREKCLAAGMNDYISKPFDPVELFAKLATWGQRCETSAPPAVPACASPRALAGISVETGLKHCFGRRELHAKLLRMFHETRSGTSGELRDALRRGDTEAASRLAHSLKSSAASIGAEALSSAAGRLEAVLCAGEDDALESALTEFDGRLGIVLEGLQAWLEEEALPVV